MNPTASVTKRAPTLAEARELAAGDFNDYFGDAPWEIVEEDARPLVEVQQSDKTELWEVDFRAESEAGKVESK